MEDGDLAEDIEIPLVFHIKVRYGATAIGFSYFVLEDKVWILNIKMFEDELISYLLQKNKNKNLQISHGLEIWLRNSESLYFEIN